MPADRSPILSMPFIQPAQAQKHVTHNEAIRLLDVAVQLAVTNRTRATPPASPAVGDRYIVASTASGLWDGQQGRIAFYAEDGWEFVQPKTGWQAYILAEAQTAVYNGALWETSAGFSTLPILGINAIADSTNRLVVSSPATLFDHAGAGHQLKVNKAAAANTASLLFQTGFSGRAEMGTMGDDSFAVKVSADGTTFIEALRIAGSTGHASLPAGILASGFTLRDGADPTKAASFTLSGITTGTQRSFTLPNTSGEIALLAGAQSFTSLKTFAAGLVVTGPSATLGNSTAASSYGVGIGATIAGATKAVAIGTDGASGSTTTITIGSAVSGALGTTIINTPVVTYADTVTDVSMISSRVTAGMLGVNTAASLANRLSLSAAGSMFTHEGASHQMKVNKASSVDTSSLSFQSGFSNRAEIGLIGSNSLAMRVSADGATFQDVLTVAPPTGQMTLLQPMVLEPQASDPGTPTDGMIWVNDTTGQLRARLAGVTRVINGQTDIPCLVPASGEHILTTTGAGGGATTTLAGSASRLDLFPFTARADIEINQLSVMVTTAVAAALGTIVVYRADANGRPAALVLQTADMDFATVGVKPATVALSLRQGVTYWLGIRHSSTATLAAWALAATPDINGGAPVTTARKTLRRTLAYATAATGTWGFLAAEINAAAATAIWARVA
jgi:hypothetical protein